MQNEKKKETERVFPNPESTQWNSMICWQGKLLFIEKILASFLLTAMKAINRTTPRGGNLP